MSDISIQSGSPSVLDFYVDEIRIPSIYEEEQKFLGKVIFFSGKSSETFNILHNDFKDRLENTRWVVLMIQLGKFVGGGGLVGCWWAGWGGFVVDTNYLYPARWGWIKNKCLHCDYYILHHVYNFVNVLLSDYKEILM